MRLELERRTLRLARPLETSFATIAERPLLLVTLTARDGVCGHGEAAPLEAYDGVGTARAESALARYREAIDGAREEPDALIEACRTADPLPAALAAIDMALWDVAARRAEKPVASLLCEEPLAAVEVNATLAGSAPAELAAQAAAAVRAGFRCVKVKVGMADESARVAAVRAAAGPGVALRVDANGAWEVEQAVQAIAALAPAGLEFVEEPVHGVRENAAVRARSEVRIAIDETAAEPGALEAGAADAVCLKVSRCGGISATLAAAAKVRAAGGEPFVASTLDGPLGVAAGLHAAAAIGAAGTMPACGLATLSLVGEEVAELAVREGEISLPSAPGLGVSPE